MNAVKNLFNFSARLTLFLTFFVCMKKSYSSADEVNKVHHHMLRQDLWYRDNVSSYKKFNLRSQKEIAVNAIAEKDIPLRVAIGRELSLTRKKIRHSPN